jgi:hypothetical protein
MDVLRDDWVRETLRPPCKLSGEGLLAKIVARTLRICIAPRRHLLATIESLGAESVSLAPEERAHLGEEATV